MPRMTDAVSAPLRPVGPLRPSPDGHHLVDADGAPFFWLGDTAWELFHRLDRDDTVRYLDDRASKGFTVVQAVAHGKLYGTSPTAPNRDGEPPYLDGDFGRPNPAFFAHVDWVIERALERGIRTALLPVWASSYVVHEAALAESGAEEYGRWLGSRYRDHGIIWVLGGDIGPVWYLPRTDDDAEPRELVDFRPLYDALAAGIRAGAGDDAFFTYHPTAGAPAEAPPPRTSPYFADRPWFALNMIQSSHIDADPAIVDEHGGYGRELVDSEWFDTFAYMWSGPYNYLPIGEEYRSEPARPVVDGEPCYEDHPRWRDTPYDGGVWYASDARNAAYHALFAGATGHTYGHVSLWDFYGAGGEREECTFFPEGFPRPVWQQGLDAPGSAQMQHARRLIESRPFLERVPDLELVVGDAGHGAAHINATRGADGSYAFVYLPRGGDVTVDLARLSGPGKAWWFDPRTGAATAIDDHPGEGTASFRAPSSGVGEDWVLVLDDASRGYGDPGAVA
jgi:hypothetical protein